MSQAHARAHGRRIAQPPPEKQFAILPHEIALDCRGVREHVLLSRPERRATSGEASRPGAWGAAAGFDTRQIVREEEALPRGGRVRRWQARWGPTTKRTPTEPQAADEKAARWP